MPDQELKASKSYAAPKLTVHGKVAALTAGGSGRNPESNSGKEMGRHK